MPAIVTPRLRLVPMTLAAVEAVLARDRRAAELAIGARFPDAWPNDDLVARAFRVSLAEIRAEPDVRLWGDSLVLLRDEPRVVGSVVFHGKPIDGVAEVGYGIDDDARGNGYATEATRACIEWALAQPNVFAVQATTFPWHHASLTVLRRCGLAQIGVRGHDLLGELLVFERRR